MGGHLYMPNSSYDTEKNILTGVLVYTCVKTPRNKYESEDKEWKTMVVVDEDTADIWNERHEKQTAKVVPNSKFEEKYKIEPVFDGKKQYLIKVAKDVLLANGEPVPEQYRPRVFVKNNVGKLVNVTASKNVGNGSEGSVSIEIYENKYGCFARLKNIKVDALVEYEDNYEEAGSEFGEEVDNSGQDFNDTPERETNEEGKEESKPKSSAKASKGGRKTKPPVNEDGDDDAPF